VLAPHLELSDPYFAAHTELVYKRVQDRVDGSETKQLLANLTVSDLSTVTSMADAVSDARKAGADFGGFSGTAHHLKFISDATFNIDISNKYQSPFEYGRVTTLRDIGEATEARATILLQLKWLKAAVYMQGAKDLNNTWADDVEAIARTGATVIAKEIGPGWVKVRWDAKREIIVKEEIELKADGEEESVNNYLRNSSSEEQVVFYLPAAATRATDIKLVQDVYNEETRGRIQSFAVIDAARRKRQGRHNEHRRPERQRLPRPPCIQGQYGRERSRGVEEKV
jgi:hypothetical protein